MALGEYFWDKVNEYVGKGDRVAELFHGEKDDILRGLAGIVKDSGMVYGIDRLNPFDGYGNMDDLLRMSNVSLLKGDVPPIPQEATNLDALFIREFIWTYPIPFDGSENPKAYGAISDAIKEGGYLVLHLNETEQENEREKYPIYQMTIDRQMPAFQKIYDFQDLMVYRKMHGKIIDQYRP